MITVQCAADKEPCHCWQSLQSPFRGSIRVFHSVVVRELARAAGFAGFLKIVNRGKRAANHYLIQNIIKMNKMDDDVAQPSELIGYSEIWPIEGNNKLFYL